MRVQATGADAVCGGRGASFNSHHCTCTFFPPPQVNLKTLRQLAVVRGLGTHALRARAWPLLLGARARSDDVSALATLAGERHADTTVVECDVERSLWSFTKGVCVCCVWGVCWFLWRTEA